MTNDDMEGLTVRVRNCLMAENICSREQAAGMGYRDILKVTNMGRKSAALVAEWAGGRLHEEWKASPEWKRRGIELRRQIRQEIHYASVAQLERVLEVLKHDNPV